MHLMILLIFLFLIISGLGAVSEQYGNFGSYLAALLLLATIAYFAAWRMLKVWRKELGNGRYQWITRFGRRYRMINALNSGAQQHLLLVLLGYVAVILSVIGISCGTALLFVGYVYTGGFCLMLGMVPLAVFDHRPDPR